MREPSRSAISAPSSRNSASMSVQRIFAETGRAKISSSVRWYFRFTGLWYQILVSFSKAWGERTSEIKH